MNGHETDYVEYTRTVEKPRAMRSELNIEHKSVKRCGAHFSECVSLVEGMAGSDRDGDQRATLVELSGETRGRSALEPFEPRAQLPAVGFEACEGNAILISRDRKLIRG